MAKNFVSNKDESVRMFKADWIDMVSRVHFSIPLYLYVPVALICLYRSIFIFENSFLAVLGLVVIGIAVWTFAEYLLHRFIFHYHPTTEWGKRMSFIMHGVHHDYPNDSKRLVMVPSISIPLCVLFYSLFYFAFGATNVDAFFVGYVIGYLFYDMTHYALHHANFKSKFWLMLKQNHMRHHYMEPDRGFGVSTTFWDLVFKSTFTGVADKKEAEITH